MNNASQVFLGGSCNPVTWREDIAIPELEKLGITYYNPQRDGWTPEMVAEENAAKLSASWLLFVIDGQTRALASMLEVTELVLSGASVVTVIEEIRDGTVIAGQMLSLREIQDLNRARAYLRDIITRNDGIIAADIPSAIQVIQRDLS